MSKELTKLRNEAHKIQSSVRAQHRKIREVIFGILDYLEKLDVCVSREEQLVNKIKDAANTAQEGNEQNTVMVDLCPTKAPIAKHTEELVKALKIQSKTNEKGN